MEAAALSKKDRKNAEFKAKRQAEAADRFRLTKFERDVLEEAASVCRCDVRTDPDLSFGVYVDRDYSRTVKEAGVPMPSGEAEYVLSYLRHLGKKRKNQPPSDAERAFWAKRAGEKRAREERERARAAR